MKAGPEANQFGAFLMTRLRDEAIGQFDRLLAGEDKSARSDLVTLTATQQLAARRAAVDAIDHGLHAFLFVLSEMVDRDDDDEGPQVAVTVGGEDVAEQSDGLHGELFGETGWFAAYSRYGPTGGDR